MYIFDCFLNNAIQNLFFDRGICRWQSERLQYNNVGFHSIISSDPITPSSPPHKHNIHSVNYSVLHVYYKQKRATSFIFCLLHQIWPNVYLMPVASYFNMLLLQRLRFMQSSPFYFQVNIVFGEQTGRGN